MDKIYLPYSSCSLIPGGKMNTKLMNQDVIIEFQLVMTRSEEATHREIRVGSAWVEG